MLKVYIGRFTRDVVSGWVIDTDQPHEAVAVSIYVDGQHVTDRLADSPRPDLARLAGFGDGRHGLRFSFPTPLTSGRPHLLTLRSTRTGEPLPGSEHLLAAEKTPAEPRPDALTPVLVTGAGRTGTTLLMSLLANSPDIVAAELLPYETRQLTYYATAHAVLSHPADTVHSTHQDQIPGDGYSIGFNPFHCEGHEAAFKDLTSVRDFSLSYAPSELDTAFVRIVSEYYRRLRQDQGKPQARYFAEKNDNLNQTVRAFARRAFGDIREIVTLRDPRDVFCSSLAYFKGLELERAFQVITHTCQFVLSIKAARADDVFLCDYRALLACDEAFLAELSAFLGTRMAPRSDSARAGMFSRHATSATADATLDRWRTDLPPDLLARCNAAWAPFLDAFGYAADMPAA